MQQRQAGLFDTGDFSSPDAPRWQLLEDDAARLAAFATDSTNPARMRHEAEVVLALFADRLAQIERRAKLEEPIVSPLGLLLLVPPTPEKAVA